MTAPLPILARHRSVVRLALIAFAAATVIGWLVDGPRYDTGYIAKAIELVLIGLLVVELVRSPNGRRPLAALCLALLAVVAAACGSGASGSNDTTSIEPNALTIRATDLAFSTSELSAPAGRALQIVFDSDEDVPHHVAIYTDSSASTRSSWRRRSVLGARSTRCRPWHPARTSSDATSTRPWPVR